MVRPIKIRASYKNDAGFLVRLSEAIEKDGRLTSEEKQALLGHIGALITLLMRAGE